MVSTIKFSQFIAGGDLAPGDSTAGLQGGANAIFTNPWTFLAPGTTGDRPVPSAAIDYRLRFNTTLEVYEYYDPIAMVWTELSGSGTGTVNPGVVNDIPFYAANGTALSPLAASANAVLVTNGSKVPSLSTTLPSGLSIPGATITSSTAALLSGSVVAAPVSGTDITNKTYVDSLFASGVDEIIGTTNQVYANGVAGTPVTGNVTLTLPQDIALGSTPTFGGLTLTSIPLGVSSGGLGEGTAPANGQIPIGSGGIYTPAAISSGTGILVGNGAGSISVALASISTLNLLANLTGGSAAPTAHTMSAIIDATIGSTQGDILYRNSTAWTVLPPGVSGQFLQTQGAAANPQWTTSSTVTPAALTSSNDTNVTITLGGTPTTALLQATSLTMGWTGQLGVSRGGTSVSSVTVVPTATAFAGWDANKNLSANNFIAGYTTTATAAGTTTLTASSTQQQFFTGSTTQTVVLPVTSTLVLGQTFFVVNNSSGVVTVQSSGGNTITAMAASTTATFTVILTSGTTAASWNSDYVLEGLTVPISLANGGTNASLVASNGGIFYSTGSAGAILAGTATAGQLLTSGASTTPAWTTSTYPLTNAANTLLYASSANTMAALATANNSVLVTSSGGAPSLSTTLPSGISATNMNLTTPKMNVINDTNGNEILLLNPMATAVNYLEIQNAASGGNVILQALGGDSNILLQLIGKGTSGVEIQGTANASAGAAGYVGEVISSTISTGSAVSISNATAKDLTSISLTAGDWDVYGHVTILGSTSNLTQGLCWCSLTSATLPDGSLYSGIGTGVSGFIAPNAPFLRVNVSSTTTVYISAYAAFAAGTASMSGSIFARRAR